jgi:hypothetical protein
MKREILKLLIPITLGGFLTAGCVVSHRSPPPERIVVEGPPAPKTEMVGTPPSSAYVWVAGYWSYMDGHWVWAPGHWDMRPRPGVVWVPGHWDHVEKGWRWTPGHWE